MEIQVVSPKGVGSSRFKKFFDEDIVIEKNSKIYLNHAILTKSEGVSFVTDQTFSLVFTQADVFGDLDLTNISLSFTIPEGSYTYNALKTTIVANLETMARFNNLPTPVAITNFSAYSGQEMINTENEKGYIGFITNNDEYVVDATNFALAPISIGITRTDDRIASNLPDDVNFNAFYMHNDPYFFNTYLNDKSDENIIELPQIVFALYAGTTKVSCGDFIADPGGKCAFGFYGREYADEASVGTGTRTDSAAIVNVPGDAGTGDYPTMFFECSVEHGTNALGADTCFLNIFGCYSTVRGVIRNWNKQQYEINEMKLITRIDLVDTVFISRDEPLSFGLGTYVSSKKSPSYRVYPFVTMLTHSGNHVLFNGFDVGVYLNSNFFNGLGTSTSIIKLSQRAFHPCFSTNRQNLGCRFYGNVPLLADDSVIIRRLRYSATDDLAKTLGFYDSSSTTGSSTSSLFLPNAIPTDITELNALPSVFEDFYRLQSYVIKINNLPIQSYKTTEVEENKGYKQSILATIPTPFQNTAFENRINLSGNDYISTTFNSYYPLIKEMRNQRITTNFFDFEIVRLSDDKLATDLDQIAINFTIMPEV